MARLCDVKRLAKSLVTLPDCLPSNHPVIREDGLLAVFLTETNLEAWRKHASVSLEEESSTRFVNRVEEMSIPRDLEEKIA
jgi:sorting nexin-8